jgi:hypothetical protein
LGDGQNLQDSNADVQEVIDLAYYVAAEQAKHAKMDLKT